MASAQDPSRRAARLNRLFRDTVAGKNPVRSASDAQRFLEAVRSQASASRCVEVLVSSPRGLDAVRDAIRSDLSTQFVLSHTLPFLGYVADPGVKALVDGQLLAQVLLVVADPPTVLNTLIGLFATRQIPDPSLYPFAWLAVELISLPANSGVKVDVVKLVEVVSGSQQFVKSEDHATRELGYRLQKIVRIRCASGPPADAGPGGPGGRHDNDLADFRRIAIYPTTDEFLSTQQPYYQTAQDVAGTDSDRRPLAHLDNQFRLLREDMLAELREDLQVATGAKRGKRTPLALGGLVPCGIETKDAAGGRFQPCTLLVQCYAGLAFLEKMEAAPARHKYLKDHSSFLRHQAFGVLIRDSEILGFAFVDRDIDRLARLPPVVSLQFTNDVGLRNALLALHAGDPRRGRVQFILVDTPVFAYEPVLLELQRMADVPLLDLLVNPTTIAGESTPGFELPLHLQMIATHLGVELDLARQPGWPKPGVVEVSTLFGSTIEVDESQCEALHLALTSPVSQIQGPPGTGKSFIGAQAVRCFVEAGQRVLVLSYTNHALDQFLEDLLEADMAADSMVRIGAKGKCTPTTAPLLLSAQPRQHRRSQDAWNIIGALKSSADVAGDKLQKLLGDYLASSSQWGDVMEYLEFAESGLLFWEALSVPDGNSDSGWKRAGKDGKEIGPDYLYHRWISGQGPGIFRIGDDLPESARAVWDMPPAVRTRHHQEWIRSMAEEQVQEIQDLSRQYNGTQAKIGVQFNESDAHILRSKEIIGCTTTGAAKYARLIRAAELDVVLVEEAGEILESHILTALSPTVKQLVLIGDHKQLRPKINNYALSVERGDGYDLNLSLFERLINQGAQHATLHKQHRMAPEISVLARELTYPHLRDGPGTSRRPEIRGLQDRVVFLNHARHEDADRQLHDRRDPGMKESKKNMFEAEMVLRCVRYFAQQGYGSEQMVVLTPYLGQLRVLQELLRRNHHDPTLSEMDKAELIRAGLVSEAAAQVDKKPLRLSTIGMSPSTHFVVCSAPTNCWGKTTTRARRATL